MLASVPKLVFASLLKIRVYSKQSLLQTCCVFVLPAPPHPCKRNGDCEKDHGRCHGRKCRCVGKMTGDGRWCRSNMEKR